MEERSAMPVSTPPATRGGSQHGLRTNPTPSERRRAATTAATAATSSSSSPGAKRKSLSSASPKAVEKAATSPTKTKTNAGNSGGGGGDGNDKDEWLERLGKLEESVTAMKSERDEMREEIRLLRDRMEEKEWQQRQLEERIKDLEAKSEDAEGGGGGELNLVTEETNARGREERMKEIAEVEKRLEARIARVEGGGGGGGGGGIEVQPRKRNRCIVITDSNGRGATHDSIMTHVPRSKREGMEVEVAVTYTLEEAFRSVDKGEIDVRGACVVIDALTNDVRGMRARPAVSPQQLVRMVDRLRRKLQMKGAAGIVVCQLKPMQVTDVSPYNTLLDEYLRAEKTNGRDGFGCRTQIRMDYLKNDGYHIGPEYCSVIDRTYACAFFGMPVPDPTPPEGFVPDAVRRKWEVEWPRLGGGRRFTEHG